MKTKIYAIILCLALTASMILSMGIVAVGESDPLITFDNDATVTGGVGAREFGINDGCAYSKGRNTYINMLITPKTQIPVTMPNLIIKFRFKIEAEEEGGLANYFQIKLYNHSGEAEVYANTNRLMQNSVWYEGQIEIGKGAVTDGKRAIKMGDSISLINFMTRNTTGKLISTYVEYIDVEEGALSSWMIPDSGKNIIESIVAEASVAKPGDVIIIPNGVYSNVDLSIVATGMEGNPVTIKAETPGLVILNGSSRLIVDGNYVVVDGLYFKDVYNIRIIQFKPTSNYCRLTNTAIINGNDDDTILDSHWVTIQGKGHEIDQCFFRYKTAYSCLFDCNGVDFKVHHNYFGYFKEGSINGFETVRIFDTEGAPEPTNFLFEYNFFDRCDGEDEVISVKSDGNKFGYNTFYDSAGALTVRHGNDQEIYGNLFIGGRQTSKTTGIRLMGNNVAVKDNYFYNLCPGSGAVVCEAGNPTGDPSVTYYPPTNALIKNNSFVNCDISLSLNRFLGQGQYRTTPGDAQIENNLFLSFVGTNPLITMVNPINGYSFSNNVVFGKPMGLGQGVSGFIEENAYLNKETEFLYFPASAGIGANPYEIAKAPKNPLDLYKNDSWIKAKIVEDQEKPFDEKNFKFTPMTEATHQRVKYNPNSNLPLNLPVSSNCIFNASAEITVNDQIFTGPKSIIFASVLDAVGYNLSEYGMLLKNKEGDLTIGAEGVTKVKAVTLKNKQGQYGILFCKAKVDTLYFVRPYAIFELNGVQSTFYGEVISFSPEP